MVNNKYPEHLSDEKQRQLFETRGIKFPEESHEKDAQKIQEIGYYKLKEFAYYFADRDEHGDIIGIKEDDITYHDASFKDLLNRYYKDKNLRIFLLHAIEDIEVYLNNVVATRLGNKYGAFGYLNFNNWCDRSIDKFFIEEKQYFFKKNLLKSASKSNLPDIKLSRNLNKEGFPSIWIMTDCLTFGNTLFLIGLMSKNNLKSISRAFNCKPTELISWLKCLNFIRNVCAHNSDLIDVEILTKPIPPVQYKDCLYKTSGGYTNKIAIVVYIVKFLMNSVNSKYRFENIKDSLINIVKNNEKLAEDLGFADVKSIKKLR